MGEERSINVTEAIHSSVVADRLRARRFVDSLASAGHALAGAVGSNV